MTKWIRIKQNFQQLSNSILSIRDYLKIICENIVFFCLVKQQIFSRLNTAFFYTSTLMNRSENQTTSENESFIPTTITFQRKEMNLFRNNTHINIEFEFIHRRSQQDENAE
jgi:hypothetical protein